MIEINNLTRSRVDKKLLEKIAKEVLKGEKQTSCFAPCNYKAIKRKGIGLSIALIGERRMKKLNRKYRRKNKVTDVLAFGQNQQKFPIFPKSELGLGEVVICLRKVKRNARRFGLAFKKELARVLIHGTLHLLGYDHERNEAEAEKMRKKQEYYLSQVIT